MDDDDDEDDGGESPLVGNFLNLCFSIFVPKFVPIFSKNIFLSQNLEVCMCVCACGGGDYCLVMTMMIMMVAAARFGGASCRQLGPGSCLRSCTSS